MRIFHEYEEHIFAYWECSNKIRQIQRKTPEPVLVLFSCEIFIFFSFLTKRLPTTVSEIRRVLFLSILFCLFGSIYFAPSQMFNVEISWNLEKILQTVSQLCMS